MTVVAAAIVEAVPCSGTPPKCLLGPVKSIIRCVERGDDGSCQYDVFKYDVVYGWRRRSMTLVGVGGNTGRQ